MPALKTKPVPFKGTRNRKGGLIAKIHVAKKQLNMVEDDYRQMLIDETGKGSSKDCSIPELEAVVNRMQHLGFKPLAKRGGKMAAQHPMARKARAMWISLYQLGAVHNPSEQALEAFAKRQLGCEKLVWARQSDANKLIEALKVMAKRAGWSQTCLNTGKALSVRVLQTSLCDVLLAKLKATGDIPDHWTLNDAAYRLSGFETGEIPWTDDDYRQVATTLGDRLREVTGSNPQQDAA